MQTALSKRKYLKSRKAFIASCMNYPVWDEGRFEIPNEGVNSFRTELARQAKSQSKNFSVTKSDVEGEYIILRLS